MARLWKRIGGELWHINPRRLRRGRRRNPLLTIIGGANPRRRRRTIMARHRRRTRRRRPNPVRSYRRRRRLSRGYNRPYRRHRRNPPAARAVPAVRLWRPGSWLPILATGAVGGMTSAVAPQVVVGPMVTTTQAYLTQAVVAFGGVFVVGWLLGPVHGLAWFIGSAVGVVQDPIRRAIAASFPGAGLSLYRGGLGQLYYAGSPSYYGGSRGVFRPTPGRRVGSGYSLPAL